MTEDEVSITITIESEVTLSISEVWPDRDQPDVITAQAVVEKLEEHGSKTRTVSDWGLADDLNVEVLVTTPNPHWSPDPPLFEIEPKPLPFLTTFDVAWERPSWRQRRLAAVTGEDAGAPGATNAGSGQ